MKESPANPFPAMFGSLTGPALLRQRRAFCHAASPCEERERARNISTRATLIRSSSIN